MTSVRRADVADATQICTILNDIIRNTTFTFTTTEKTAVQVAEEINSRRDAFQVAMSDDQVIGFATYFPFRDGPGYARCKEVSIHISAHARGQGIGRMLMIALEASAKAQEVHSLIAGISSSNPDAQGFHTRLGFTQAGHLPQVGRKDGQWLDLILMQKIL